MDISQYDLYFLDNKYTRYYFKIVENALTRKIPNGYIERHHILPKSFGGSNKKHNRVSLTAKEHFIVHHLLIYMCKTKSQTQKMYKAFFRMHFGEGRIFFARTYKLARENVDKSHQINPTIYHFYHPDHGDEVCRMYDLCIKYNLNSATVYGAILRDRRRCKGWGLAGIDYRSDTSDLVAYHFIHKSGIEEICKRKELYTKYTYLNKNDVGRIVRNNSLVKGWRLITTDEDTSKHDRTIYEFIHPVHGKINCLRKELQNTYNISSSSLHRLVTKKSSMCEGWKIEGTPLKENTRLDKIKYRFVNLEHGNEYMSRHELAEKYNLNPNYIGDVIRGTYKSTYGWKLAD